MCTNKLNDERFSDIIQDIKELYLSKENMPKLIIGTGLSRSYKLPGMNELYSTLETEFNKLDDDNCLKKMWVDKADKIKENGLEAGLASLTEGENELVDKIKKITIKLMLDSEITEYKNIYTNDTGFKKLISYLKNTCSVNKSIIDIMTPNYDRIIEIVADSLKIPLITGFTGEYIKNFSQNHLKNPSLLYSLKDNIFIRLFKPHGSTNWITTEGKTIMCNDSTVLYNNLSDSAIITPGASKYKEGLTNNLFRCMRESFNETLEQNNYSLFIYGYGFNDEHFNTVLYDSFSNNPALIISKSINKKIIEIASSNKKMTLFYNEDNKNYVIYKSEKHEIEYDMWDMNTFSELMFS